jgi:hypothetical protein
LLLLLPPRDGCERVRVQAEGVIKRV